MFSHVMTPILLIIACFEGITGYALFIYNYEPLNWKVYLHHSGMQNILDIFSEHKYKYNIQLAFILL